MKAIYKFIVDSTTQEVDMQIDAKILSAGFQGDNLCVWAMVDSGSVKLPRKFKAFGTGHEVPIEIEDYLNFVDTCYMENGMVFHLFEVTDT